MLMLPTRGRPREFARFFEAYLATASLTQKLLVRLDDDDPLLSKYELDDSALQAVIGKRVGAAACWNEMFKMYPDEPSYGLIADDTVPKSPFWDRVMADACIGRIAVGGEMGCCLYIDGRMIRDIGFISPPGLIHLCVDTFWEDIGRAANAYDVVPNVVIEHIHFSNRNAPLDKTYEDHFLYSKADIERYNAFKASGAFSLAIDKVRQWRIKRTS